MPVHRIWTDERIWNDSNYEMHQSHILSLLDKWVSILGLDHWEIGIKFSRNQGPDGAVYQTQSEVSADWRYLRATITWYSGTAKDATQPDKLEEEILHELLHIVLDELPNDDSKNYRAHEERVITQLSRRIARSLKKENSDATAEGD